MKAPFLRIVAGTAVAGPSDHPSSPSAAAMETDRSADRVPRTATHANKLARDQRSDAWHVAEAVTRYWRARLNLYSAAQCAQMWGLPEALNHPQLDEGGRMGLVGRLREAEASQLLTPAPTAAAVVWKKAQVCSERIKYLPVETGQVERAIEADEAFLAAHPMRRKKA